MYTEKHIRDLNQFLELEEGWMKSVFLKELKISRDVIPQTPLLKKRPSWNNNTSKSEDEVPVKCSWPTGNESGNECMCRLCNSEQLQVDDRFKNFRDRLLGLKTTTELHDFVIVNKKYLNALFETKLALVKSDILMKEWKKVATPVLAVSKFKSALK